MAVSFGELADLLQRRVAILPRIAREGTVTGAQMIREKAQAMLGHYQADWPPLTPGTQADRVRKGFPADEPLLRTGALRDAIKVRPTVDGASVGVHGDSEMALIASVQEYGSVNVPPRPFVSTATYQTEEAALAVIEGRVAAVLDGKL